MQADTFLDKQKASGVGQGTLTVNVFHTHNKQILDVVGQRDFANVNVHASDKRQCINDVIEPLVPLCSFCFCQEFFFCTRKNHKPKLLSQSFFFFPRNSSRWKTDRKKEFDSQIKEASGTKKCCYPGCLGTKTANHCIHKSDRRHPWLAIPPIRTLTLPTV